MTQPSFRAVTGRDVPAVTADEMAAVDRVAVEDVGLQLLQMMENAGRVLAWHVRELLGDAGDVVVVAGNGGNGGGGLACARHLANREVSVQVVLDRPASELTGAAAVQCGILEKMAVPITISFDGVGSPTRSTVIVDALIGYGLSGAVKAPQRGYIERMNESAAPIVSLDGPSGLDATTGDRRGIAVAPARTVTLALPKTGLRGLDGSLHLADIGIPSAVYDRLDIPYQSPFADHDSVLLSS